MAMRFVFCWLRYCHHVLFGVCFLIAADSLDSYTLNVESNRFDSDQCTFLGEQTWTGEVVG